MAKRIQMRRDRPWRKDHPDAVIVDRSTKWGNPYVGDGKTVDRAYVSRLFREYLARPENGEKVARIKSELRGRDLACWCPLDQPCHADVLLELANGPTADAIGSHAPPHPTSDDG